MPPVSRCLDRDRLSDAPGHLRREPVDGGRHAARERFADREDVGGKAVLPRVPARTGRDRVRFVEDEERPGPPRRGPQRVVKARVGQHDADVRQGRLGEDARNVAERELPLEGRDVVELDDARRDGGIHRRAEVPVARADGAVAQGRERLVHRAVVAAVEDEDARAARDVAGEPDREAVRVGGGQGDLPDGEAEPARELLGDGDRVLRREHEGEPATGLRGDRLDRGGRRVAGHGARVAEAEVEVPVAVHVAEVRALRVFDEEGESACPPHHPVHGHAAEKARPRAIEQRPGLRVLRRESLLFLGEARRQAPPVDRHFGVGVSRTGMSGRGAIGGAGFRSRGSFAISFRSSLIA